MVASSATRPRARIRKCTVTLGITWSPQTKPPSLCDGTLITVAGGAGTAGPSNGGPEVAGGMKWVERHSPASA